MQYVYLLPVVAEEAKGGLGIGRLSVQHNSAIFLMYCFSYFKRVINTLLNVYALV